jgi:hypothetical protein
VAGLALLLATAGCGGSTGVTGPEDTGRTTSGSAVVQGTMVGGAVAALSSGGVSALSDDSGWTVRVEGTGLSTSVDEEGEFILAGVPASTIILIFEGPGPTAHLTLSGLLDGQVLSLQVHISGGTATVTSPTSNSPTTDTKITGVLESVSGTHLVVAGQAVDASHVNKVWRGKRRIQLDGLEVGEKLKVWGTLGGDGVIVAEEIKALSSASQDEFTAFKGTVQSVGFSALDVNANPNGSFPTLVVAGREVRTSGGTKFRWSDGTSLNPHDIKVGDKAYVEGWKKGGGAVSATKLKVDCND